MKRVLLLMTTQTYRAGAFLEAAQKLHVPVVVGSERDQALATLNPAGHLTLDFTRPEEATQAIVDFAQTTPLGAVISADDDGAILAATASNALGLRHSPVEAVAAARDKSRTRQLFSEAGLPSPSFATYSCAEDPQGMAQLVRFPCVLKPLSLAASRGVIRANDPDEFVAAFLRIAALLEKSRPVGSGEPQLLVEDFIPGPEFSLEGLLSEGKLRTLALFDKPDPLEGPFFEETIYVTPSRLPRAAQKSIRQASQEAVSTLGLHEGPVHVELRLKDGDPWVLEVAPRSIGGLCSRALRFGDGASLEEVILRHALGEDLSRRERETQASGVMMIPIARGGILRKVKGQREAEAVPGIEEIRITIPVGQEVVPLPEGDRYLGFIFARARSPEKVETSLREAHKRLTFLFG